MNLFVHSDNLLYKNKSQLSTVIYNIMFHSLHFVFFIWALVVVLIILTAELKSMQKPSLSIVLEKKKMCK